MAAGIIKVSTRKVERGRRHWSMQLGEAGNERDYMGTIPVRALSDSGCQGNGKSREVTFRVFNKFDEYGFVN